MESNERYEDRVLARARDLVKHLESGDQDAADAILSDLTNIHETKMFEELGKLTRELHDTLTGFKVDTRIAGIAEHDIPDAKERLDYVIRLTDQAAHKTLSAVEESIPVCDALVEQTRKLSGDWKRFMAREMSADQFRELVGQIDAFMHSTADECGALKGYLNEVLIAQDFQDLTGQTIRRVIKLVQDVEESLVDFIKASSRKTMEGVVKERRDDLGGPQIPGKEDVDAITSQDEVDELLSSLGF